MSDPDLSGNLAPYLCRLTQEHRLLINEGFSFLPRGVVKQAPLSTSAVENWMFMSREKALAALQANYSITKILASNERTRIEQPGVFEIYTMELATLEEAIAILSAPPTYNHS